MGYATLRMNGREYVLVPKPEFRRMTAEDRADAAAVRHARAQKRSGKLKTYSLEEVGRRLGYAK